MANLEAVHYPHMVEKEDIYNKYSNKHKTQYTMCIINMHTCTYFSTVLLLLLLLPWDIEFN